MKGIEYIVLVLLAWLVVRSIFAERQPSKTAGPIVYRTTTPKDDFKLDRICAECAHPEYACICWMLYK